MLEDVVEPLNDTSFDVTHWISQQDSAPVHKSQLRQQWLCNFFKEFIEPKQWPSGSPDLNPLDYQLW